MNALVDDCLVGLMLLMSLLYAFAKLGPRNARRSMLAMLARVLQRAPAALRATSMAQRLAGAAGAKEQGACGGCDTCGSESRAAPTPAEIRVPIARIGRARHSR
jgi:hypothetical protein